jgi:1-acyl-sn-glycerol-3-phosphate acyltransferase
MGKRARYVPHNYRWFNKLLRFGFGSWLKPFFRIRSVGGEIARSLQPPFVLVANHVTVLDPFMLSSFLREPVYWITADGNMRTRVMKALLRLVGSIPKSKAIPDLETVGWTVDVIRKRGGVVGIFPEGQASWAGVTLPLVPSTAKLLKLLKVPVLAAVIRGGYSSFPRWTKALRRGRMEIDFSVALGPEELKALSVEEIAARLKSALAHDETAWNEKRRIAYDAVRRAERLELSLFMCPVCASIGSMKSARSRFYCLSCGESLKLDARGRFKGTNSHESRFSNIRDWDEWQAEAFAEKLLFLRCSNGGRPIFSDAGAVLLRGHKLNPLRAVRTGTLILYADRMELATLFGERIAFPLAELDGVGVLKRDLLEFYRGHDLYQVRFPLRDVSARKWQMGIETLSRAAGETR